MRDSQLLIANTLTATVDDLCQQFGVWKTARALARAAWRQRQTTSHVSHLSNRMRRDIGLPESDDTPEQIGSFLWDIRI
ncbi:DUF1127 domain-containing protein [Sinorhizobium alkalisoli]|uniref:DUF1127 domain-containing protein n=1 Tax=Sinorhizobium alkalisoli TaxID=1752398 RepID=A0A1E3V3J3_9HYPH|nr:DUF1127 domain-containing protein [Sinorhizobium alkalisoli]MCA1491634.1 DUF1127 domain-containing protein [Ensifer sp. NBAIM29]MCG5482433.1 DUF1127 domain-containing protein [Sinorhizobium meliloti]ODR88202.1 DUF1127 domain-containing protein [Sinorhizobium alkalisoli]